MLKYILSHLLLLLSTLAIAQDISGKWVGNYSTSFLGTGMQKLEVDIEVYNDSLIRGTSHLIYGGSRHEKYAINGVYTPSKSTIYFSEDEEISVNLGLLASNVLGNYTMILTVLDSIMRMEGRWEQNNSGFFNLMSSRVWLEKPIPRKELQETPEPTKQTIDTVAKIAIVDKNQARDIQIQKTIEIEESERNNIRIELTDNARIDNDIVSVYINDVQQLSNERISDIALSLNFSIPETDQEAIVMIAAESYGAMPPCTALMTITTNSNKYIVDLSSTFGTNAAVKFVVKQ